MVLEIHIFADRGALGVSYEGIRTDPVPTSPAYAKLQAANTPALRRLFDDTEEDLTPACR